LNVLIKNRNLTLIYIVIATFIFVTVFNLIIGSWSIANVVEYKTSSIYYSCALCGYLDGSSSNTADICQKPCNPINGFDESYVHLTSVVYFVFISFLLRFLFQYARSISVLFAGLLSISLLFLHEMYKDLWYTGYADSVF